MFRYRMFSQCYKAVPGWTRSSDKWRGPSAGNTSVIKCLTTSPQHNARGCSFDFLFPWTSANIPYMGFIAREDYDTGNVITWKLCRHLTYVCFLLITSGRFQGFNFHLRM
jgi:hypothetical protein